MVPETVERSFSAEEGTDQVTEDVKVLDDTMLVPIWQ